MTVAVRLRPRSKLVISTRIRLLRRSMGTRLARELRRFFAAQARRVVLRLEHGHQLRYEDVKLHDVNALLPPEEDGFLRLVLGPYLDSGIVSFADLAALMVSGATDETRGAGVQRLLDQAGGRIVGINDTTRNAVRDALNEANVQGYNLFQTAHGVAEDGFRGIASIVEQTYAGRAEAIARTEMGWASQAAAQAQWREMGVQQQEIIDGEDSDEECAARNGTTVSIEEDVELLHPNCFPAGERVTVDGIVVATSRSYEGKLITIRTSLDNSLRCTPNHPILTGRGWVGAGELVEGDDVFSYRPKLAGVAPPAHEYVEASVEEVAGALLMASFHARGSVGSFASSADQFHGDGGTEGDVDVVGAAGLLLRDSDPLPLDFQLEHQGIFSFTAVELEAFARFSAEQLRTERISLTTAGSVSSISRARAHGPASTMEHPVQVSPVAADISADMGERFAAFVSFVQRGYVVAIEESSFVGHVYNLQTQAGFIIAEGLVTSNCTVLCLPAVTDSANVTQPVGGASGEELLNETYVAMANAYDLPRAEFEAGNVPGFRLAPQSNASSEHTMAATTTPGRITLYPRYFSQSLEERQIIIQHEMGHWVDFTMDRALRDELLTPFEKDGRIVVSFATKDTPHEVMASAYTALGDFTPTGLAKYESDAPLFRLMTEVARQAQQIGLPVPTQWAGL